MAFETNRFRSSSTPTSTVLALLPPLGRGLAQPSGRMDGDSDHGRIFLVVLVTGGKRTGEQTEGQKDRQRQCTRFLVSAMGLVPSNMTRMTAVPEADIISCFALITKGRTTKPHLVETNVIGLFPEALSANIQLVLPDKAVTVACDITKMVHPQALRVASGRSSCPRSFTSLHEAKWRE